MNAGIRFVTEMCKMRAFVDLWDEICETRYGVTDPKFRRFRYGVQVNSLGLTEQQPENNVYRILIEMLAVTLSKKARARAVQLPAWNEALGLPRPWDQQWSLRMQQIMAYETDLLEYDDLFDGNPAVDRKVEALKEGARAELANLDSMGGAIGAIDYMKVAAGRQQRRTPEPDRTERDDRGRREQMAAGRTLAADDRRWRHHDGRSGGGSRTDRPPERTGAAARDADAVAEALADLRAAAKEGRNIMPASIARRQGRGHHRRMGRRRCAPSLANIAAPPACPDPVATRPKGWTISAMP